MAQGQVLINGVRQGWGDISFVAFNRVFTGITSISVKSDQDKTNEYGWGNEAVHRGRGNHTYDEVSITMYHYEIFTLLRLLGPGKDLTDIVPVTVTIVFEPTGDDILSRIDLPMFEFKSSGLGIDMKQGDKSIPVKLMAICGKPILK